MLTRVNKFTSISNSKQGIHPFLRRYSTSLAKLSADRGGRYESVSNFFLPIGGNHRGYFFFYLVHQELYTFASTSA